jgi:hypothetical protein
MFVLMTNSIDSSSWLAGIVRYSDEGAASQKEQCIIITCNGDYIVHHGVRNSDVAILCVKTDCNGQPHVIEGTLLQPSQSRSDLQGTNKKWPP